MNFSGKNIATGWLTGQFLVAMLGMRDPRFIHALIYIFSHTPSGALGLIVNQPHPNMLFADIAAQLELMGENPRVNPPLYLGGPVEPSRGFVLHSAEYNLSDTLRVDDTISLTATVRVLEDIAGQVGPKKSLITLGYASWGAGQLESEIAENSWIPVEADEMLIFDPHCADKWERALGKIAPHAAMMLSAESGRA